MNQDLNGRILIGSPHLAFDQLPSTNAHLKDWVRDRERVGPKAGTVVSARVQTSGYGQHGRVWSAVPGKALTFSVWIPGPPVPHLTIRAALAVSEALDFCLTPDVLRFKWVNDLVVRGRKLGGILAEGIAGPDLDRTGTVLGIGLNIETPEGVPHATGLNDLFRDGTISWKRPATDTLKSADDEAQREVLLHALFRTLASWITPEREPLEAYRHRLSHLGERVHLEHATHRVEGVARDIDGQGNLVIELDDGTIKHCHAGTLRLADGRYA